MIRKITKRVIATTVALAIAITPLANLKINNQPQEAQAASTDGMENAKRWTKIGMMQSLDKHKKSLGKEYETLKAWVDAREREYKDDRTFSEKGNEITGARYLTWTVTNKKASGGIRWRTVGYYITPQPLSDKPKTVAYKNRVSKSVPNYKVDATKGFKIGSKYRIKYDIGASSNGTMITTRHVLSSNYVTKEIKKWNKNHPKNQFKELEDGIAGYLVYFQPIIEAYNANTKKVIKGNILSVKDWINALGPGMHWADSSTFHTNYNFEYKWTEKTPEPQYVQVHYIEENNPDNKLDNDPEEVVYKDGGKTYQIAGSLYGDETAQLYKSEIENEGEHYVITGFYATYGEKESKNAKSQLSATKVVEAYETQNDPNPTKLKVVKDSHRLNRDNLTGKSFIYTKYETEIKNSKIKMENQEYTHIYFTYQKAENVDDNSDNAPGTPDYKVRVLYEYQYYEDGKYVWKTAKSPEYLNDVDVFSRVFADTLKDEARPYYGLYSIEAVDDSTKETIPNEVPNSQSEVSDGNNYFYYDTARWKYYKSLVESTKYTIPKDSSITITVRYAARIPYVQLMYTATKSENGEISYTLTNSRLGTTDERHCPGETVTVSFPSLAADGTAYAYGYGSSGSVAGYGGATDNGWTINSLPIASTDASAKTKLTLVCPEEPLYAVGVYGEIGMPAVDPTPPEPIVVPPPAPNYTDSNYPSLQWCHHGGSVHVDDNEDSTKGSAAINQNFNCEIRVIFII